jgi:hypothetical protein
MLIKKIRVKSNELRVGEKPTSPLNCSRAKVLERLSIGIGIVTTEGSISLCSACPANGEPVVIYSHRALIEVERPYDIDARRRAGEKSLRALSVSAMDGASSATLGGDKLGCQTCSVGYNGKPEIRAVMEDTSANFSSQGMIREVTLD